MTRFLSHSFFIPFFLLLLQYEGWYKDDLRHGRGKYVWSDRDVYDGEWKNHMKHGYGEFRFASGASYQGMWREDNRHGQGKYRLLNGEIYEGEYKDDLRDGEGTYLFRSGAKYDGSWSKHLKNGRGKLYKGDLLVYDGEWVDDKPQGYVDPLLIFEDDIQYLEVMTVIEQARAAPPSVTQGPIVRMLEPLAPAGNNMTRSKMTDEYYNDDGILDEDDDFHPKNLFRRKSEDWIDKAPKFVASTEVSGGDNDEEKNEYLQEFHVEKEDAKKNFISAGAVDEDRHDRVKKMFSPVRKVVKAMHMVNVSPAKEKNEQKAGDNEDEGNNTEQDEASVEESSARRESNFDITSELLVQ